MDGFARWPDAAAALLDAALLPLSPSSLSTQEPAVTACGAGATVPDSALLGTVGLNVAFNLVNLAFSPDTHTRYPESRIFQGVRF